MKFKHLFYKTKIRDGYKITRILFFRRKERIEMSNSDSNEQIILPRPNIEKVGKCSYIGIDCHIISPNSSIGAFCSIGCRVILGHGEHPSEYLSTSPYLYLDGIQYKDKGHTSHNEYLYDKIEPITIGNDVWIGDGVFIKNGVKVGDGAIIGARSVVTKDVPAYTVVVGTPAKVIKYRFDEQTIKDLLDLKWWDLDDDIIRKIPYDNISESIKFLKRIKETDK